MFRSKECVIVCMKAKTYSMVLVFKICLAVLRSAGDLLRTYTFLVENEGETQPEKLAKKGEN